MHSWSRFGGIVGGPQDLIFHLRFDRYPDISGSSSAREGLLPDGREFLGAGDGDLAGFTGSHYLSNCASMKLTSLKFGVVEEGPTCSWIKAVLSPVRHLVYISS